MSTPFIDSNGSKFWYQNGKRHRTDGPAVEWANGSKSWYINGKEYTQKQFIEWQEIQKAIAHNNKETGLNTDF